jgi:hypothetical protein
MNIIKENCRVFQGNPGKEIAALKTIKAYNKAYTEKGITPTGKDDYSRCNLEEIIEE